VIDDTSGKDAGRGVHPLARAQGRQGKKKELAKQVGKLVAKKCRSERSPVVFDRNGFMYHGRIAAVAKGAREGGLKF